MSAAATARIHDSDSEDDPDFVPDARHESDSSGDERDANHAGSPSPRLTAEEKAAQKRARAELWAGFQASVAAPAPPPPPAGARAPRTVTIEKRYRFAGEDVVEVKEVPEDSDDARRWPAVRAEADAPPVAPTAAAAASTSASTPPTKCDPASASSDAPTQAAGAAAPSSSPAPRTAGASAGAGKKPPGRRKPRVQLAELPGASSQKAKKLTTLEKSAMDWQAHVQSHHDPAVKDELEANKRGGGYLEKVQFLQRVDERKDEIFDANKARKRRRT